MNELNFEQELNFNQNVCNVDDSYIYYVMSNDTNGNSTITNYCLYIVCDDDIIIDDPHNTDICLD